MSSNDDNRNKRPQKNPVLIFLALIIFVPMLALSKMRGLGSSSEPASPDVGSNDPPVMLLIFGVIVLGAVIGLAGSYLKK